MKKNRFARILALLLSCLFIMGAFSGVVSFAEDGDAVADPTVSIKYKNIAYEDAIKIMYYVESANVAEGQSVKLITSDAPIDDVVITAETKLVAPAGKLTVGAGAEAAEYDAFVSEDIAPANLRKNVYAVAVVVDADNNIVAESDVLCYNVFQYCMDRIDKGASAEQKALYTALLDFGASVQEVLIADKADLTIDQLGGWANAYYGVQVDSYVGEQSYKTEKYYFTENAIGTEQVIKVDKLLDLGNNRAMLQSASGGKGMTVTANGNELSVKVVGKVGFSNVSCNYKPGLAYCGFDTDDTGIVSAKFFGTVIPDGANGNGDWIMKETLEDGTTNSFLRAVKRLEGAGHTVNFNMSTVETEGVSEYTLDFDYRWNGAKALNGTDKGVMIIKYFNEAGAQAGAYTPSADIDAPCYFGTHSAAVGEWTALRFRLYETAENVWTVETYVNGELSHTATKVNSKTVPTVCFELRWAAPYDISMDFDNVFANAE